VSAADTVQCGTVATGRAVVATGRVVAGRVVAAATWRAVVATGRVVEVSATVVVSPSLVLVSSKMSTVDALVVVGFRSLADREKWHAGATSTITVARAATAGRRRAIAHQRSHTAGL
jgi:hypothetical protein